MKTASLFNKLVILILCSLFLASCVPNKRYVYLQELDKNSTYSDTFKYSRNNYKLQVNDNINVDILTKNVDFVKLFNISPNGGAQNMAQLAGNGGNDMYYTTGFQINDSGQVLFPVIGYIKVVGLTIEEARVKIQNELVVFQSDVNVVVRIGGLRFSLLGEFARPGKYSVLQSQLTIFEAIATGGDLKDLARRDRIILLRQYPEGARIHYINVLDKNLVNSPLYFIQPNDLIYAEPLKRRAYGIGTNGLETLSTALAIISTSLLLINFFKR